MNEEKKAVLDALGGIPEDVYDSLAAEALGQARAALGPMRDACAAGDLAALRSLAHSIKGTAANLRLSQLCAAAARVETIAKEACLEQAGTAIAGLESAVNRGVQWEQE